MNTKQRLTLRAAQAIREAIVCRITQDQYWTLPEPPGTSAIGWPA